MSKSVFHGVDGAVLIGEKRGHVLLLVGGGDKEVSDLLVQVLSHLGEFLYLLDESVSFFV